jgi:hypothetical protein
VYSDRKYAGDALGIVHDLVSFDVIQLRKPHSTKSPSPGGSHQAATQLEPDEAEMSTHR